MTLAPKTIINAGSVGEPRHGGTESTYVILDTQSGDAEICSVPYDVERTAHAMIERDVPSEFAERLRRGQELAKKSKEIFCGC